MFWIIVSVVEFVMINCAMLVAKDYKDDKEHWHKCCCEAESRYDKNYNMILDKNEEIRKLNNNNKELKAFIFTNLKEVYAKKEKKDEDN